MTAPAGPTARTALRPDDLAGLSLASAPTLSPDGRTVVCAVHTVSADRRATHSRLIRVDVGSGAVTPFAADAAGDDTAPAFAPDSSSVAFVSTRTGERRVHLATPDGSDVRLVDDLPGPVATFAWSGDAPIAAVERPADVDETGTRIDWLRYLADGRPGFLPPVTELWCGRERLPLSGGVLTSWTVRGRRVIYVVEAARSDEPSPGADLRVHDVDSGQDELWWAAPAPITAVVATDLGGQVVAVTSGVAGQSVDPPRLWQVDASGARLLFPDTDVDCERAVLSDARPPGRVTLLRPVAGTDTVLHLDTVGNDVTVQAADLSSGRRRRLVGPGSSVVDFSAATRDGELAVVLESATRPAELFVTSVHTTADGAGPPLTALNAGWCAGRSFVEPETLVATSADGFVVESLLHRAGPGPRPLVVRLHGGPHLAFGATFDLETQLFVDAGYSVLAPAMRGTAGRGPAVRAGSVGEWGRADRGDVLAAVDRAVADGIADPGHLHLIGGSYGGFLVNSLLTCTDRFQSAVSERSVSNLISKIGTSDNGYTTNRFELGGLDLPGDAAEIWARSPLSAVDRIRTPLLLIHGEDDRRCPIEQSEQLFVALRRLGRDCVFLRVPHESHSFTTSGRPDRRIRRLTEILAWFAARSS